MSWQLSKEGKRNFTAGNHVKGGHGTEIWLGQSRGKIERTEVKLMGIEGFFRMKLLAGISLLIMVFVAFFIIWLIFTTR